MSAQKVFVCVIYVAAMLAGCAHGRLGGQLETVVACVALYVIAGMTMLLLLDGSDTRFAFTDRLSWWRVGLLWLVWPLAPWLIKPQARRRD